MEVFDDFREVFLSFVFTRDVGEFDTVGGLYIDLGVALTHVEHHGVRTARVLHHLFCEKLSESPENEYGNYPR